MTLRNRGYLEEAEIKAGHHVRAKKNLKSSDGDRIKKGDEGEVMWTSKRGSKRKIEVLLYGSSKFIQDTFDYNDWEKV